MKGMEYRDASGNPELTEQLIVEPGWWFQQKMDGTRVMIDLETLAVTQRNGNPLKHTAATQWIPTILYELGRLGISGTANAILDCELIISDGSLYIFDVINPAHPAERLMDRVERMTRMPTGRYVNVVTTAKTPEEKRDLLERCRSAEGVVAKDMLAPYQPGKRSESVLKIKNVHTADLVVTRLSESPLSARLGVFTADGRITIASASMIGKDPDIQVGDVVEVDYLAWTGASLLQPRIIRKRHDKLPDACHLDQFKTYSRRAV